MNDLLLHQAYDYLTMKIFSKDFISIIAQIGTFISAVIAVYTLREIKKQRLAMYQPELFLKSFCVTPTFNPLGRKKELLMYKFSNFNDYSVNTNNVQPDLFPLYKLDNMGFGVAKDITCKWEFDYKKAISEIEKHLPNNYKIRFSNDFYSINNLDDDEFYRHALINSLEYEVQKIDYISPINVSNHNHKHAIPDIIMFSYNYYLIFKNKLTSELSESFYSENFKDFPKPKLTITYKDLNNKCYRKEYSFKVSAASLGPDDFIDINKEFAIFYFICE